MKTNNLLSEMFNYFLSYKRMNQWYKENLLNLSTINKIVSKPLDFGRPTMKSMETSSQI